MISVGDREADVYDLFVVARPPGVDLLGVDLLVCWCALPGTGA